MKLGAFDYLVKPCNPDEPDDDRQRARVGDLERENAPTGRVARTRGCGDLIGHSAPMLELYHTIEAVARTPAPS
jgi:DNA-binding NtrC family response regulator